MKKILVSAALLVTAAFSACTDDPTGTVTYSVDLSRLGDVAEVRIVLDGADMEVSAAVSSETTLQGILDAVPVGTYATVAEAFAEGATVASASVSGSVTVEEDMVAVLDILFGSSTIETISVSNNTPQTGEVVTLTANLGDDSAPQLLWSDDCAGNFISNGEVSVEWSTDEAATCTISVKLAASEASATTTELKVGLATGTRVLLAGTGDCIGHTYSSYEYDDSATKVAGDVWSANGYYLDETGQDAKTFTFDRLTGLDLDAEGRAVFSDRNGGRIVRLEKDGTLTRVAGTARPQENGGNASGAATLDTSVYWPHQLEVAENGDIYFAEAWGRRIKKIYADGNTIATWAGNGGWGGGTYNGVDPLSEQVAGYSVPMGVDSDGNTYFGNVGWSYNYIYKVYASGYTMSTILNNVSPWDIDVHGGMIYFTERFRHRVARATLEGGQFEVLAGEEYEPGFDGDGRDGRNTLLNSPRGLMVDGEGVVYFADTGNGRIRKIGKDGVVTTVLENSGVVSELVFDANRNIIQARHDTCSIEKVIGPF